MGRKKKKAGRILTLEEKQKRGCTYCLEPEGGEYATRCPHKVCPYHVLDKYEYYEDFLVSEDAHAIGAVIAKISEDRCPLYPGGTEIWNRWREIAAKRAAKKEKQ